MLSREIYMKKINSFIGHELIKVITGIKRCGKSYFLNLIIQELYKRNIKKENIILINFNERPYKYIDNRHDLDLIVDDLIKNVNSKVYLFFDEIQNVDKWEESILSFTALYDCDIYITSSNSKILSGKLANILTERFIQIKMFPFSFNEFLEYKNNFTTSLDDLFNEYLIYGGIPFIYSLDDDSKKDYLDDLFSSILLNDIVSRHNIRDVAILKRLTEFIFDNVGKAVSLTNIIEYLAKNKIKVSRKTLYNYLDYLKESCLVYQAGDDFRASVSEKYYVCDLGLSQAINWKNLNISSLVENIVYIELLRRDYDVTVGKVDGKEIDFVCKRNNKIIYIQVSHHLGSDEAIEREFGSLLLIKDNYPKYVISMDKFDFSQKGIIHLNLIDFLTNKKGDI